MKKLFALFATVMIMSGMAVSASAVEARAIPCPECGNPMGHTTSYGPWYYDHEEKCEHYHYGNDVYYERIVTHYERCQRCGFDNSYTSTQSKMECEGHN